MVFAGFGRVAREFARLLVEKERELASRFDVQFEVRAILTKRHGKVQSKRGIDLRDALRAIESDRDISSVGEPVLGRNSYFIRTCGANMLVELTPLVLQERQEALDYIKAALASGKHVITANKGPVVFAHRQLKALAEKKRVGFRYEGTVMDGAPVFNLFENTLKGLKLLSFHGILSSVTNLILTRLEEGGSYEEALSEAGRMSLLEADPRMDLEGWDAAVKACLLVNVLMGGKLKPWDVKRSGISSLGRSDVDKALAEGNVIRQIASGLRVGRVLLASVDLVSLPADHLLATVRGTGNALLATTDLLGEIMISERAPGLRQTAYALYSDLLHVSEMTKG